MRFTISSEEKLAMDVMPTGVIIHRPQGPRGGRMSAISVRNEDIPFLAKALQQVLNANREVESLFPSPSRRPPARSSAAAAATPAARIAARRCRSPR
jgi:hypothetical protein